MSSTGEMPRFQGCLGCLPRLFSCDAENWMVLPDDVFFSSSSFLLFFAFFSSLLQHHPMLDI